MCVCIKISMLIVEDLRVCICHCLWMSFVCACVCATVAVVATKPQAYQPLLLLITK